MANTKTDLPRISAIDLLHKTLNHQHIERAEVTANLCLLHLLSGNHEAAHQVITSHSCELKLSKCRSNLSDMSLSEIGMSVEICDLLENKQGIYTVCDLYGAKLGDLFGTNGISVLTVVEIFRQISLTAVNQKLACDLEIEKMKLVKPWS